ncbi:MAG: hypothetical protein HQM11_05595 [SAR324 cluster bacterium]|nr:hypothetical protein [SAR324 cluster bacterium]
MFENYEGNINAEKSALTITGGCPEDWRAGFQYEKPDVSRKTGTIDDLSAIMKNYALKVPVPQA